MLCPKCGNSLMSDEKVCNRCGYVFFNNTNMAPAPPELIVENLEESDYQPSPSIDNSPPPISNQEEGKVETHPIEPIYEAPIVEKEEISSSNEKVESLEPIEETSSSESRKESPNYPTIDSSNTMKIEVNDAPPVVEKEEKSSNSNILFIAIVAILSIIIVVFGILIFTKSFSGNSSSKTDNTNKEYAGLETKDVYSYEGFELPYLESYEKKLDKNGLLILFDYKNKIQMNINIVSGTVLEDFKEETNHLKELLVQSGYIVDSMDSKTIEKVDWLLFQGTVLQQGIEYKYVYGYATLGNYHVWESLIFDVTGNYSDLALESLSKTIKNATYHGSKNYSIEEEEKKDITIHHKDDSIANDLKS